MTVDNDLLARLQPLCLDERETARYPEIRRPVSVTHDGIRYLCATQGHLAVFIASEIDAPTAAVDFEGAIFARYMPSDLRVNTATLMEFTGAPQFDWECKCPNCEEGVHGPEIRQGYINDVLCDLNLLACCLSVVPVEDAELSLNDKEPIFLRGSNWWISLMPMRSENGDNLPRFDVSA